MRMLAAIYLVLCFSVSPVTAASRLSDAESLLDVCASGNRDSVIFCAAFFKGFFAGVFTAQALTNSHIRTCLPDRLPDTAARKAFFDYLSKHPERAKGDLFNVAIDALREAYPCAPSN